MPTWIRDVRDLFPADTCETITRHALERYAMTELVTEQQAGRPAQHLGLDRQALGARLAGQGEQPPPAVRIGMLLVQGEGHRPAALAHEAAEGAANGAPAESEDAGPLAIVGHEPQLSVPPHVSSRSPHAACGTAAHVVGCAVISVLLPMAE